VGHPSIPSDAALRTRVAQIRIGDKLLVLGCPYGTRS
jgi:hypothetical protein